VFEYAIDLENSQYKPIFPRTLAIAPNMATPPKTLKSKQPFEKTLKELLRLECHMKH
jgi:hypothetical protein